MEETGDALEKAKSVEEKKAKREKKGEGEEGDEELKKAKKDKAASRREKPRSSSRAKVLGEEESKIAKDDDKQEGEADAATEKLRKAKKEKNGAESPIEKLKGEKRTGSRREKREKPGEKASDPTAEDPETPETAKKPKKSKSDDATDPEASKKARKPKTEAEAGDTPKKARKSKKAKLPTDEEDGATQRELVQEESAPEKTDEEKFKELMEAKKAGGGAPMNLTPIVPQDDEPKKKERRGFFGFGKKKKEAVVGGIIAGSVKHEGHAGFDSGGLSTKGLPPQLAEFFEKLDKLFKGLGYEGVTQQEVTFVLQKYGDILLPSSKPPVPEVVERSPADLTHEELLQQYNSQATALNGLKMTHTTIQTAKAKLKAEVEDLNTQLDAERNRFREQTDKNTSLEVELARLRAGGATAEGGEDVFAKLEATFAQKLEEANARLAEEQERTRALQAQLDEYADEQARLMGQLGESHEVLKQNQQVGLLKY